MLVKLILMGGDLRMFVDAHAAIVYVNQVGGQDELLFDGASFVVDAAGDLVTRLPQFEEQVAVVDLDLRATFRPRLLDPR